MFFARPGQTITQHTHECITGTSLNAKKIGLEKTGALLGALHDLGKWSPFFQEYINGKGDKYRGSVDHSTAGAQHLWHHFTDNNQKRENYETYFIQIIALCCLSHHKGCLIDNLKMDGINYFKARINKSDMESHLGDALKNMPKEEAYQIQSMFEDDSLRKEWRSFDERLRNNKKSGKEIKYQYGLLGRFLLSSLVDADHSSAGGNPVESASALPPWDKMSANLNNYLERFTSHEQIDELRKEISQRSLNAANCPQGKFLMTLPTGAGKTLASLRFALAHAQKHHLDRLIYVIPYTSIIDQNAAVIRDALGREFEDLIFIHHSNVTVEPKNEPSGGEFSREEENRHQVECTWHSPIILTTAVQFLQTLFSKGSSYVRRMNSLACSVIIFDEVQALPLKSTYLLTSALNFMDEVMRCSLILCTATQPILDQLENENWRLRLNPNSHIIPDYPKYFKLFRSRRKTTWNIIEESPKWELQKFADFALNKAKEGKNTLMIVNTKSFARNLYEICEKPTNIRIYHLSTNMTPEDRTEIIQHKIDKYSLEKAKKTGKSILCFSTQLIEAGVDVDFDVVIRSASGLDSLVQAEGRCNRNGLQEKGEFFVVFPSKKLENTDSLEEIRIGKSLLQRIFSDVHENADLLKEEKRLYSFYRYYYAEQKCKLTYPLNDGSYTMMDLLSTNGTIKEDATRISEAPITSMLLYQSFEKVAETYRVIEGVSTPVIVNEGRGAQIIEKLRDLAHPHSPEEWRNVKKLLRKAMKYTISLTCSEQELDSMQKDGVLVLLPVDYHVYMLSKSYYDKNTGFHWTRGEQYAKNTDALIF